MMVRFATTCDKPRGPEYRGELGGRCSKRSNEYEAWPSCRECGADLCPDHMAPGTYRDADLGRAASALCLECAEQ